MGPNSNCNLMTMYPAMYLYIKYPSVNLIHNVDIYILYEMRSPHSGLLAGVLDSGCLYKADRLIPLRAFGVGNGVTGLALGVAALPVLGVFVCVGIGFHQSRVWQISFWCSPIVCRAFGWWELVAVWVCAFGVGGVTVPWFAWALWG